jgi:4-diphosphocytidyl-2-C-methyl-D-erythritol kinase
VTSGSSGLYARVRCPAKVNLHLEVIGRRGDGFHEVATLLQSIDVFDDLEGRLDPAGELALEVRPAGAVTAGPDNLVVRAGHALRQHTGVRFGAKMLLTKRIPVGGGLGGGSADAAAALVLLDRLWGLRLDSRELGELAVGLGSDVPFFLGGGLALGTGRGDRVAPLDDLPPYGIVVVSEGGPVATSEVYDRLGPRLTASGVEANVRRLAHRLRSGGGWDGARNDLEPVVTAGWPEVAEALGTLRATGPLHAAVSGSGSAVFAVYPDVEAARRALPASGWQWAHAGAILDRARARLTVESGEAER